MKRLYVHRFRFYSDVVFTLATSIIMLLIWWGIYTPAENGVVRTLLIIGTVFVPPGYLYRIYKLERVRLALKQDG